MNGSDGSFEAKPDTEYLAAAKCMYEPFENA